MSAYMSAYACPPSKETMTVYPYNSETQKYYNKVDSLLSITETIHIVVSNSENPEGLVV